MAKGEETVLTSDSTTEATVEYREGHSAYLKGKPDTTNPYETGKGLNNSRFRWFVGWLDARTEAKGL